MPKFGHEFKKKYYSQLYDDVIPVNHGSYGTTPTKVIDRLKKASL